MVKPASRKGLVGYLQQRYQISEGRGCRVIPISRKAVRYCPKRRAQDTALSERLKALGEQYPRYGYLTLHGLLRAEGLVKNRKRTYRLYAEPGMQVRSRRRKKLVRPRIPMVVPDRPNQRWSMDIVHDQLTDGRRFRILNIIDDFSRVCIGQVVDLSISGNRIVRCLEQIRESRPLPHSVVLDNGPEMTSKAMFFWSQRSGVRLHFIQPGKPTQNAYVERFNRTVRHEWLDEHLFESIDHAQRAATQWLWRYNNERPNMAIGGITPKQKLARVA